MKKSIVTVALLASACLHAAEPPAIEAQNNILEPQRNIVATGQSEARSTRFWKLSLAGLAAANALDVGSSWGKHELNGVLRSPDGSFGSQGAALKMGFQGAFVAAESLIVRHDRRGNRRRVAAWINVAAGAAIGAVAAHNFRVPGR